MQKLWNAWNGISLVKRIVAGLIVGAILGVVLPQAQVISVLGDLFVGALKALAPVLVFFLVMSSLAHHKEGKSTNMKTVILLYLLGTAWFVIQTGSELGHALSLCVYPFIPFDLGKIVLASLFGKLIRGALAKSSLLPV